MKLYIELYMSTQIFHKNKKKNFLEKQGVNKYGCLGGNKKKRQITDFCQFKSHITYRNHNHVAGSLLKIAVITSHRKESSISCQFPCVMHFTAQGVFSVLHHNL